MKRAVVVTTEYKGVFFGFTEDTSGDTISLTEARCAMYWDKGGWMSLASQGPDAKCNISDTAMVLSVRKMTAVADCTEEAIKAWQSAPIYKKH